MKNQTISNSVMCAKGLLERPRYFPRQLITPAEMTQEQEYFREKLRLHNRMLHGWGVVCGALVCRVPVQDNNNGNGVSELDPWRVKVKPGYVLGPYGDDIVIDCEHKIDIRTLGMNAVTGEPPEQALDPWCSDVTVKRDGPLYIAVKYKECMTRPVRVQPVGCGCDDTQCEYSRWCDGYEIGILDVCPPSHEGEPPDLEFKGEIPTCPGCPKDPWVVLAKVTIDEEGAVEEIDNCSCRRLVVALGNLWWRCEYEAAEALGPPLTIDRFLIDGAEQPVTRKPGLYEIEIVGDMRGVLADRTSLVFKIDIDRKTTEISTKIGAVKERSLIAEFEIEPGISAGPWDAVVAVANRQELRLPGVLKVDRNGG